MSNQILVCLLCGKYELTYVNLCLYLNNFQPTSILTILAVGPDVWIFLGCRPTTEVVVMSTRWLMRRSLGTSIFINWTTWNKKKIYIIIQFFILQSEQYFIHCLISSIYFENRVLIFLEKQTISFSIGVPVPHLEIFRFRYRYSLSNDKKTHK